MKSIYITFEDDEFEELLLKKGDKTWREYILEISNNISKGGLIGS